MMDFQEKARDLVMNQFNERSELTDKFVLSMRDVYVVWFTYTLGNWKCLISTTVPDGMYYEVTYNKETGEAYVDAYKKFYNVAVVL